MIIDFHVHVLPPRIKSDRQTYVERDAAFAEIYSNSKAGVATAEDLIESMDRDGIDYSVIVNYSWRTHELCAEINDYILESVARYPDRLAGFCAVSSLTDEESLAEIGRCQRGGAIGVGELRPDKLLPDFIDKASLKPFIEVLRKNRLILMLHASEPVGHVYPGKGSATPKVLYEFIQHAPGLPVVLAHWGGGLPFYTLMPEVKKALGSAYYDTAASPFLYGPEIYARASDIVGADRIIFGSDYPVMQPERIIREIQSSGLGEGDKAGILSGNARRLLGI